MTFDRICLHYIELCWIHFELCCPYSSILAHMGPGVRCWAGDLEASTINNCACAMTTCVWLMSFTIFMYNMYMLSEFHHPYSDACVWWNVLVIYRCMCMVDSFLYACALWNVLVTWLRAWWNVWITDPQINPYTHAHTWKVHWMKTYIML